MPQRLRQTIYHLPKKRPKSGKKIQQALKHQRMLLARVKTEGETKWLKNALERNAVKLKRYRVLHLVQAA